METVEHLPPEDREIIELVEALSGTGNLQPLIALLREGQIGPERARDALLMLGEYDLGLLVQLSLDTLIDGYVTDPGMAHQTRRQARGSDPRS